MGYTGQTLQQTVTSFGRQLEIVKRPRRWLWCPADLSVEQYALERQLAPISSFQLLPKRWLVERTFAWLNKYRRLSKDYEYHCTTSETFLFAAMSKTMLKRLVC